MSCWWAVTHSTPSSDMNTEKSFLVEFHLILLYIYSVGFSLIFIKINKPEWHSILRSICCQCTLILALCFNSSIEADPRSVCSMFYSRAILSPSLWQVNSIALSTMARVTLRPGLSSSGRQREDTERKSTRHSLAAGTWSLGKTMFFNIRSMEGIRLTTALTFQIVFYFLFQPKRSDHSPSPVNAVKWSHLASRML